MFLTASLTLTSINRFSLWKLLPLRGAAGKVQEKFLGIKPGRCGGWFVANWTGEFDKRKNTTHKSGVGNQVFKNVQTLHQVPNVARHLYQNLTLFTQFVGGVPFIKPFSFCGRACTSPLALFSIQVTLQFQLHPNHHPRRRDWMPGGLPMFRYIINPYYWVDNHPLLYSRTSDNPSVQIPHPLPYGGNGHLRKWDFTLPWK